MINDNGIVLKTIRNVAPGEPLLMWFTENILAMLSIPFLTPSNIQGKHLSKKKKKRSTLEKLLASRNQFKLKFKFLTKYTFMISGKNRYICHICNKLFEYPNPLKIHLALKCNRLDTNHLWSVLTKEFALSSRPSLSLSLFPQSTFRFKLTRSPEPSSTGISPILVETMDNNVIPPNNNSSESSEQPSPSSSNPFSPSSVQISPKDPSIRVSPTGKDILPYRQSAFKPYTNQSNMFANVCPLSRTDTVLTSYNVQTSTASISTDVHAAQMETIVSNLGKSKQGHLCIYCGKVYSRKYGLKIHIR